MDKRTMMENYSFNSFVSVAIPKFDEIIIIKGDYHGYILKMIKDGKLSLDKVAEYSGLSIEKVRELAGNKSA